MYDNIDHHYIVDLDSTKRLVPRKGDFLLANIARKHLTV